MLFNSIYSFFSISYQREFIVLQTISPQTRKRRFAAISTPPPPSTSLDHFYYKYICRRKSVNYNNIN